MKILNYIITLFLISSAISCTEDIEVSYSTGETYLIVDGELTNQIQDHYVYLTLSAPYFQNEANEPVNDATVMLSNGSSDIILEALGDSGTYVIPADYVTEIGITYTITISDIDIDNDGVTESYQASNVMKAVPPINRIDLQWYNSMGMKLWKVLLYTQDPEDTEDYYAFALSLNEEDLTPQITDLEYADDTYFNGNEVNGVWAQSIIEEEDGELSEELELGDWVKFEMQSINEDYYDFIDAVNEETGVKVPLFSGPSANVPTNLSEGALGFFRVYSVAKDSIKVTQSILDQKEED